MSFGGTGRLVWGLGFKVRDVPGGAPAPALILRPLPPDHPSPGPTQSSVKHSATIEAQGFDSLRLRGLQTKGLGWCSGHLNSYDRLNLNPPAPAPLNKTTNLLLWKNKSC